MKKAFIAAFLSMILINACKKDDNGKMEPIEDNTDLTGIPCGPSPHDLVIPAGLPSMNIPADNPLTDEGIELGRFLFYDPILSVDSTISCASCHQLKYSFTDLNTKSIGINGLQGPRSSMPLLNVGFFNLGLFWDGRSPNLEDQALHPVENPLEMAEIWDNVEVKLQNHPAYPKMFREAFCINNTSEITRDLAAKALAQFERTLISANSRFDQKIYQGNNNPFLWSDAEVDGYLIYFDDATGSEKLGHCAHCHDGKGLLSSERYENNGIEAVASLDDFPDKGLGAVTGKRSDNGKFKAPSLRNIALTAPYMHDGRFATLEEVIDHYNSGGHYADNLLLASIQPLHLTETDKANLLAFLQTFTDTSYYSNPAFQNPFQ
ncbi:MAG: cytochrome C peroxidase [Lewinellaceae bacterium]|nr:cytochrome C peroxidase [Saprospiraceae bacterium]MCB9339259.1 cytochrome C peroxidase [Lewinellaceae bacterium]